MTDRISRRTLLKAGAAAATTFGFSLEPARAAAKHLKIAHTTQTQSICPYCAVGCSVILHTLGDKAHNVKSSVVHVEGDPNSPVNRGTLCPKGISLKQFIVNERRLTKPRYRAPGATEFAEIEWDEGISKMARRIKDSRDQGFEERDDQGRLVNRLDNVAIIGGCTDTNEINYLISKFRFALGVLTYENQARL